MKNLSSSMPGAFWMAGYQKSLSLRILNRHLAL
jgi:hypothetical protein